jgi:WD40 repeat protein
MHDIMEGPKRTTVEAKATKDPTRAKQSIIIILPQLPTLLWIEHVLPHLDRVSWNRLCSTYKELYEAARSTQSPAPWPQKSLRIGSAVRSVAFSPPDGGLLACGGENGIVRIWNRRDGRYTLLEGHARFIRTIAFSPDGKLLASGSDDNTVRLWTLSDNSCRVLEGHDTWVMTVAFSPDGAFLAAGSGDRSIRIWDVNDGRCTRTLLDEGMAFGALSVAFSPDGGTLAAGGVAIHLWNLSDQSDDGHHPTRIDSLQDTLNSITYSPDGRYLATGSWDSTVRLWYTSDFTCKAVLKGHTRFVRSVSFSPNGKILASGSDDESIRFWNVETATNMAILPKQDQHECIVFSVVFCPDDGRTTLATGSLDGTVRLWNPNDDRRKQKGNWNELISLWNAKV